MWKNGRENKPAKRGKMVEKMTLSANEFWRRNFVLKDLELNHSLKTFRFGQNLAMAMEIPYGSFNPNHQKKKKKNLKSKTPLTAAGVSIYLFGLFKFMERIKFEN
jgi:hypothetical protein